MKKIIYFLIIQFLTITGYGIEQHMLLYAPFVESSTVVILELHPSGNITYTGQYFIPGSGFPHYGSTRSDQKFTIIPGGGFIAQFENHPNGQVSLLESLNQPSSAAYYHPYMNMIITGVGSTGLIIPFKEDGKMDTTDIHYYNGRIGWIHPQGKMMISREPENRIAVYQIDTINISINKIQDMFVGSVYDACFLPDNSQFLMSIGAVTGNANMAVFEVLQEGKLDTTFQLITLKNPSTNNSLAGLGSIALTPDGKYLFVSAYSNDMVVTITKDTVTGQWYSMNKWVNLKDPWTLRLAPDWNLLVVRHYTTTGGHSMISSFYVTSEGDLIPTGYSFPFSQTFGDNPVDLVFAYPPGITGIRDEQWEIYE